MLPDQINGGNMGLAGRLPSNCSKVGSDVGATIDGSVGVELPKLLGLSMLVGVGMAVTDESPEFNDDGAAVTDDGATVTDEGSACKTFADDSGGAVFSVYEVPARKLATLFQRRCRWFPACPMAMW
jgi:hypothetical protein